MIEQGQAGGTIELSQPASPARPAAVAFIFLTILLDMLALGLIVPILPKLVESFVDNDTARAARIFGLFGTAWALMQFVFSSILGSLSDRFGRRPVVLLSNFGLGLDYLLMALAPSLIWLFVAKGGTDLAEYRRSTLGRCGVRNVGKSGRHARRGDARNYPADEEPDQGGRQRHQ